MLSCVKEVRVVPCNLKELRATNGISQQQLADAIGLSQASIWKYENQIGEPTLDTLMKLADYFDVSVDYLIGHNSETNECFPTRVTNLSYDEREMLSIYRKLSQGEKDGVRRILRSHCKNK